MDKKEHPSGITSHKLVVLVLPSLEAGMEAGENFTRVKSFVDSNILKNQSFHFCFNAYFSGLPTSFLWLPKQITKTNSVLK